MGKDVVVVFSSCSITSHPKSSSSFERFMGFLLNALTFKCLLPTRWMILNWKSYNITI
jgi:hypothetical protein